MSNPVEDVVAQEIDLPSGNENGLPPVRFALRTDDRSDSATWVPREVYVEEALSGETSARLTIETDDGNADSEALLGSSVTLVMSRKGQADQRFSGIVRWAGDERWDAHDRLAVSVTIEPAFSCLQEDTETRCFVGMSRPEVLKKILGGALASYGREVDLQLGRSHEKPDSPRRYPKLDFIQQRGETTFAFARRLMAEEGMTYFFDHAGKVEKMIVVDENHLFPLLKGSPIRLVPAAGHVRTFESLDGFSLGSARRPASYTVKGFDASRPGVRLDHQARTAEDQATPARSGVPGDAEIYDPLTPFAIHEYKGDQYTATDMEVQAQLRLEAAQREGRVGRGRGDVMAFRSGQVFELGTANLRRLAWAGRYIISRITHHGEADRSGTGSYSNQFSCIPATVPYRPTRLPRPKIGGIDLGIVTASGDEQIWADKHGRAKVRFLWDRAPGDPSEGDSSWIPVVLNWAGPGYGMQIMPRKGMVVAIAYYGGDPDLPMIVGTIATSDNSHPHELPRLGSCFSIVSQSMRDGGNDAEHYHEITLDDAADAEKLILRSGWDFFLTVLRDSTTKIVRDEDHKVGNDQTLFVGGNRERTVAKNEIVTIKADRTDTVRGIEKRVVDMDQDVTLGGARETRVAKEDTAKVGGDRHTAITGSDELHVETDSTTTVKGVLKVKQGGTVLEYADGHVDLTAENWIRIRRGSVEVFIDEESNVTVSTSKKVTLQAATLALNADTISIEAKTEASIKVGASTLKMDGTEVQISATNITETAASMHQTTAGIILQN